LGRREEPIREGVGKGRKSSGEAAGIPSSAWGGGLISKETTWERKLARGKVREDAETVREEDRVETGGCLESGFAGGRQKGRGKDKL